MRKENVNITFEKNMVAVFENRHGALKEGRIVLVKDKTVRIWTGLIHAETVLKSNVLDTYHDHH